MINKKTGSGTADWIFGHKYGLYSIFFDRIVYALSILLTTNGCVVLF